MTRKRAKEEHIDRLFEDWTEWFERTRRMVDDPNPYVDVKGFFWGEMMDLIGIENEAEFFPPERYPTF